MPRGNTIVDFIIIDIVYSQFTKVSIIAPIPILMKNMMRDDATYLTSTRISSTYCR